MIDLDCPTCDCMSTFRLGFGGKTLECKSCGFKYAIVPLTEIYSVESVFCVRDGEHKYNDDYTVIVPDISEAREVLLDHFDRLICGWDIPEDKKITLRDLVGTPKKVNIFNDIELDEDLCLNKKAKGTKASELWVKLNLHRDLLIEAEWVDIIDKIVSSVDELWDIQGTRILDSYDIGAFKLSPFGKDRLDV